MKRNIKPINGSYLASITSSSRWQRSRRHEFCSTPYCSKHLYEMHQNNFTRNGIRDILTAKFWTSCKRSLLSVAAKWIETV